MDERRRNARQLITCMKGKKTDLDEIYEKFGVDYNLISQIMCKEMDENGRSYIRWGQQKIA